MNEYITESFKVAVLKKEIVGKPLSNQCLDRGKKGYNDYNIMK